MKILITGFDAFGGEAINPSEKAVFSLPDEICGAKIVKKILSTTAYRCLRELRLAILEENPDIVLCIGQAGGSTGLCVEKVAINLNDFRIADNEGNKLMDTPIFKDGANAYFTDLPVKAMVKEIKKRGIPAAVSYSAGTFVCNHVFYGCLYMIEKEFQNLKGGFIHIPYLTSQVVEKQGAASMSLATLKSGLEAAIEAAVRYEDDIHEAAGNLY